MNGDPIDGTKAKMDMIDSCAQILDLLDVYVPDDDDVGRLRSVVDAALGKVMQEYCDTHDSDDGMNESSDRDKIPESEMMLYQVLLSTVIGFSEMEPAHSRKLTELREDLTELILSSRAAESDLES